MNIFGKTITLLFLVGGMLASCNSVESIPTLSDAEIRDTAISTVNTALAETQSAIPTAIRTHTPHPLPTISFSALNTLTPSSVPTIGPSSTPLVFTDPSIPLSERIVYYRGVMPGENPIPEGAVRAGYLLAPTYADETYTDDTASDLKTALEIVLHVDDRGMWRSSDVEVTFRNGHADVVLRGEYHVAGGGQLWAASWQILMTVFANPSVQTATVTFNGATIANLGISEGRFAKPDDYVYSRAEVEAFMKENAYVSP